MKAHIELLNENDNDMSKNNGYDTLEIYLILCNKLGFSGNNIIIMLLFSHGIKWAPSSIITP